MKKASSIDRRSVLAYELVGMVFMMIIGSLLHFTFEWSGGNLMVGAFSVANESVSGSI